MLRASSHLQIPEPLSISEAETFICQEQEDTLLEQIVARSKTVTAGAEVTLIEGLVPTRQHPFADQLNARIAETLDAEIIFVIAPGNDSPAHLKERIEVACAGYGGTKNQQISGVIINKVNAPVDAQGRTRPDLSDLFEHQGETSQPRMEMLQALNASPIRVLGCVPGMKR